MAVYVGHQMAPSPRQFSLHAPDLYEPRHLPQSALLMAAIVSDFVNVQLAKLHQAITTWISTETLDQHKHIRT